MHDYEKLGAFYLGRRWDPSTAAATDELVLYDAKDLTTHAVCVGMTGSGKTGLCVALLEEAALDGVPAIVIDPKGDLSNLCLTFPDLLPADFEPWIDPAEAARKGMAVPDYAARTAETWRRGLSEWDQDGERIRRFRDAAELVVFTPGSSSGTPLNILRSLAAPGESLRDDPDALRERIASAVSGLLALLGHDADPVRSRDHILLSNLVESAWRTGRDLDLARLVQDIQAPPLRRVGVLDVDTFYPPGERFRLATTVNNLLASPSFRAWMEGEPLDVARLLWTDDGKPRISVVSISHLSEAERMFFVTMLLNEVLAWVRTQSGTSSLRAVLYMDEVFGFFPPTAEPPSKRPMLTLLKQARAFGLGIVLATQNPVDLDYKGLANAGTWFLGRLQTERDKARVLDGLQSVGTAAGAALDASRLDSLLSSLRSRVFLLHNVHDDAPVLFHTRWAMSYLRGPLTRVQIAELSRRAAPDPPSLVPAAPPPPSSAVPQRPVVPPEIPQRFAAPTQPLPPTARLVYRPALVGRSHVHFVDRRLKIDHWTTFDVVAAPPDDPQVPWQQSEAIPLRLDEGPLPSAEFYPPPSVLLEPRNFPRFKRELAGTLYRERRLTLWRDSASGALSRPEEPRPEFVARLSLLRRQQRDLAVEKLRVSYAPRVRRIQDRLDRAEAKVEKEKGQVRQQAVQTAISVGATMLGALFGRKATSLSSVGRATTAARGVGRIARERSDVERAEDERSRLATELVELEAELASEIAALSEGAPDPSADIVPVEIAPRKADIDVDSVALLWIPWRIDADGSARRLIER